MITKDDSSFRFLSQNFFLKLCYKASVAQYSESTHLVLELRLAFAGQQVNISGRKCQKKEHQVEDHPSITESSMQCLHCAIKRIFLNDPNHDSFGILHSLIIGREVLILTLYVLLALQGCIS